MATYTDAQHALIARLQAMPGRPPLAYPNMGQTPGLPRIVVQVSTQTGMALTFGGVSDALTEIVAQVEVAEGEGTAQADAIAQAIVDHFPLHLRFADLVIQQPPQPRPPIQGDGYYAVPVVIRARHFFPR